MFDKRVDGVNNALLCLDRRLPSTACEVQGKPGGGTAAAFDVNAACPGWLYSLTVAEGLIAAFEAFYKNPRPGEVYNLGGCRQNSCSMLEAIEAAQGLTGKKITTTYKDQNRKGDHICYISDMSKFRSHYPNWELTKSLQQIYKELAA